MVNLLPISRFLCFFQGLQQNLSYQRRYLHLWCKQTSVMHCNPVLRAKQNWSSSEREVKQTLPCFLTKRVSSHFSLRPFPTEHSDMIGPRARIILTASVGRQPYVHIERSHVFALRWLEASPPTPQNITLGSPYVISPSRSPSSIIPTINTFQPLGRIRACVH